MESCVEMQADTVSDIRFWRQRRDEQGVARKRVPVFGVEYCVADFSKLVESLRAAQTEVASKEEACAGIGLFRYRKRKFDDMYH